MKKELNAGVIGLGVGRHHIMNFRNSRARVLAICDVNARRLEEVKAEFDIPHAFARIDEMLAVKELDLVTVAVPNFLHAEAVIKALRAGKHVLCEKPMAMNAREAKKMALAAKASGRKFMMHFNYRFSPQAQALKEYADRGVVGNIYYARTVWNRMRGMPGLGGWFTTKEKSGGGPLIDLGVHRLDLALWLMGNPAAVSVSGYCHDRLGRDLACRQGKKMDVEDFAAAFVRLDNGAVLSLEASWASNIEPREEMSTVILGTKGSLFHTNIGEGYEMDAKVVAERFGSVEIVRPKGFSPRYASPQQHFADCILEDTEPMATAEHGVRVMEILDAIYESAAKGREVKVRRQDLTPKPGKKKRGKPCR